MHCHICDVDSDSVTLTEPCGTCIEVINDCIAGYPDVKNGDDPIVEEEFDVGC